MAIFNLNETMYVKKARAGVQDLTTGFGQESQNRAGNPETPVTQINASHFRGVLVFTTLNEMEKTEVAYMGDIKVAYVIETGQIYNFEGNPQGGSWVDSSERPTYVADLTALASLQTYNSFVVVKDVITGGIFVYDESKKDVDNGGTIINGWVRQFYGAANIKWFGAKGNGSTDDTFAITKALSSGLPIFFPSGSYSITETIQFANNTNVSGEEGATILSVSDIPFFKLASGSVVRNLIFKGQPDLNNQNGVLVDGGASLQEVEKTRVIDCKFVSIGGDAYKLINSSGDGHIVQNCVISVNKSGVNLGYQGNGLILDGCIIESNGVGVTTAGGAMSCSSCVIQNNQINVNIVAGAVGLDSQSVFNACIITGASTFDVQASNTTNKGLMFVGCSIFGKLMFLQASGMNFKGCNLSSSQITFNQSNDNCFENCLTNNILVNNNVGGVNTKNLFVGCYTGDFTYNDGNSSDLSGGYLEVWEDVTDFSITNNQATTVTFSKSIQKLPYQDTVAEDLFFDKSTGTFDFTKVTLPSSKNFVFADIQLCLNDTSNYASQQNLAVYLYKVDDVSDDVNTKIDLSRVTAVLANTGLSFQNNASIFAFSGSVPRGRYKLVVKCNNLSGKSFRKQGTQITGSLINAPYKARFWGI